MLKRLLLPLLLLTLALTGCAEKKPVSAQLTVTDQPFTASFPPEWKVIPKSRMPNSDGMTFVVAYTSASTADLRLPLISVARVDEGKLSESEILIISDTIGESFVEDFSGKNAPLTINKQVYDGQRKRLYVDLNFEGPDGSKRRALIISVFTEEGLLVFYGLTAKGDVKGITQVRQILDSITIAPELQYR